ncbi:DUF4153 domain-containing protein [Altererythrobacter sp. Root672]|uniref:DUF4153 domain-containing protein n=1 Tax=Altererythrobacter sp. Root672 TaxID=1736584 RepID=UPI0006F9EBFB|nr:DUF4153 domain-containing protein [Altererythrobacter sp. Root672]KRA84341.1 hypothetical protein ASD76_10275 [Altererythrobacter sp. Root672]
MTEQTASGDHVDVSGTTDQTSPHDWPLRPWILAALLGLAGLLIHFATKDSEQVAWRMALAAFLFFGPIAAGFTLERERWKEPAIFSVGVGLVMAGLTWRAVRYGEYLPDEQYGFAAGVVATALALPLFQADFHRRRLKTPYREIYGHVWTDVISAAGALAFTGLSWVVLALISELFRLLKIDLLHNLMDQAWFGWTFSGLAAGAALGTIRNQLKVLATMQTVVLLVASLLAVPLAVGLVVFLLATAVSGPQVLWDATRSATPLLLACAAGSFVLANAIARQDDEAMTRSRVMRIAGLVLAAVILPLAVFAAFSMGQRLNQYGLAPERLWGLVAIVVACVCGVGYWVALIRGRRTGWATQMRSATFHFGLFVCGLAVLLALPILDFGAISTRSQVARLENGRVKPAKFDFAALRWDFGEPGKRALQRLVKDSNADIAERAQLALAQAERTYPGYDHSIRTDNEIELRMQPEDAELRRLVLDYLKTDQYWCREGCVAVDLGRSADGVRRVALLEGAELYGYLTLLIEDGKPAVKAPDRRVQSVPLRNNSQMEVRPVTERYLFIDGKRLGNPIE